MAKIGAMPEQAIIDGFKGSIDFYLYKGQPCVRKWPSWKRRQPWPDEKANQQAFAYVAKMWLHIPLFLRQSYNEMAVSLPITGRDIFIRGYLKGAKHLWPIP